MRRRKVVLYSHDTFGLGHLRRNLAIAEQLLAGPERFAVTLLTGSPVIGEWRLPRGLCVQPMPPVIKVGAERYAAREPGQPFGLVKGYREALILKTLLRTRPDVFLVDHAPAGMNGELLSALALIRRELPNTRAVLGLRDILDSPSVVRATWEEQEIPALLAEGYDEILVYGSRALFDVVEGYGLAEEIAERVHYCGHVVNKRRRVGEPCWSAARAGGRPVVLVTAGGGGDGFFLMEATLAALARLPRGQFHTVIVTGPLMREAEREALCESATGRDDIEFVACTTDLVPSLRAANLIIAMAGYNTTAEIIAHRQRAILVPRAAPRAEQRMRASLLARLGLVRTIEPGPDLAAELTAAIPLSLESPAPDATAWSALDLRGAERVAEHLARPRIALPGAERCAA